MKIPTDKRNTVIGLLNCFENRSQNSEPVDISHILNDDNSKYVYYIVRDDVIVEVSNDMVKWESVNGQS